VNIGRKCAGADRTYIASFEIFGGLLDLISNEGKSGTSDVELESDRVVDSQSKSQIVRTAIVPRTSDMNSIQKNQYQSPTSGSSSSKKREVELGMPV
jgi:hypothetical protein